MKHKLMLKSLGIAITGMALMTGCSTVAISSDGAMANGERLLSIQSDGYALLDCIPLWTGTVHVDAKGQPEPRFAMFSDRTRSDVLYAKAKAIARAQNCDLTNVVFVNNYKGIDFTSFYGLLTVYDVSISAVLKAR